MFQPRRTYTFYKKERSTARGVWSVLRFVVLLVLIYAVVTSFLLASYKVDNETMAPLLTEEERLFASPLPYGARLPLVDRRILNISEPNRGDIAIVRLPYAREAGAGERLLDFFVRLGTAHTQALRRTENEGRRVVRRIVGLPGDTVRVEDDVAYIRPAGAESFSSEFQHSSTRYEIVRPDRPQLWEGDAPFGGSRPEITLGEEEYFIVADNRAVALDSRHFGPIGRDRILEKVIFRYWPLARFGVPGN